MKTIPRGVRLIIGNRKSVYFAAGDELAAIETLEQPILSTPVESLRKPRNEALPNPKNPLVALI